MKSINHRVIGRKDVNCFFLKKINISLPTDAYGTIVHNRRMYTRKVKTGKKVIR